MRKMLVAVMLACLLVPATVLGADWKEKGKKVKNNSEITIGLSMKTLNEQRWVTELGVIENVCKELGVNLIYQVSNVETQTQIAQIENMITQGIDILIAIPSELDAMYHVFDYARERGVMVVNYERVYGEVYVDMCAGLDDYKVGTCITKPLADANVTGNVAFIFGHSAGGNTLMNFRQGMIDGIKDCDYTNIFEQYCENWDASIAQGYAENVITQYGNNISAFAVMNDGMAAGVIQALGAAGLAGKVMVTGQDADITALQRIIEGTQTNTVFKNSQEAARKCVESAVALYKGEQIKATTATNSLGQEIPFVTVEPIVITKDNIDEVLIDGGIYTKEEIYG